ncbi:MAG: cation:proton antiporter [Clostridia bacterium]|nr:cation:proton antiporter [Clostridia bacterium]
MNTSLILLSLSIALLVGLLLTRLAKLLSLPAVTAYLVTGILIGPFCLGALNIKGLGFTSLEEVNGYGILCDLALGFIAFSIGNEFRLSQLKKIGKQATIIGIFQAVFTTALVDVALIIVHLCNPEVLPLPAAIILGAVASATAPAATLMVVKQYKAKGKLTDILLPVVALDDAVGLVLFAISFGVAKTISVGKIDVLSVVLEPLLEVVLSLGLGALVGLLFTLTEKVFHSRSKRLAISVTYIMFTVAISNLSFTLGGIHIAFSPLLTCMMLGTIFCNICDFSEELMERADRWTTPLYVLFFVLSGAALDLSLFSQIAVVIVGLVFIIVRSFGKYTGAGLSAKLSGCDSSIVKYLGITLLPQAGVAIGMASKALVLGEVGVMVQSITLFAVLVYELVGPYLTKIALIKAGDINLENRTSARNVAKKSA